MKRFENFRILMLMAAIMLGLAAEAQAFSCGQDGHEIFAADAERRTQTAVF